MRKLFRVSLLSLLVLTAASCSPSPSATSPTPSPTAAQTLAATTSTYSSDQLLTYRAEFLKEAEEKYNLLTNVSEQQMQGQVASQKTLCADGKTRELNPGDFDPDTFLGCVNGRAFALDKAAYIDAYVNWKMSIIAP